MLTAVLDREQGRAAGGAPVSMVIELLRDASRRLGTEHSVARDHIVRAQALLRVEGEGRANGGLAPWQIARVKAYVEEHIDRRVQISDLARISRLSVRHFSQAFRVSLGQRPHAYLVERRIIRAQGLMLSTTDPLCEIALACGLADQAHLSRLFRRATGQSPSAWRRERS